MRVLKNNCEANNIENIKVEPYPRELICEHCGSVLEYDESDLYIGAWGCVHLDCPCCGEDNMLDTHEKNITLTKDNIQFPIHFHHCCVENGAIDCCNNERVREFINNGINYFRKNKNEYSWNCATGNLCVYISRYDGDEMYDVVVTNNYYSMDIPFEKEDYRHEED